MAVRRDVGSVFVWGYGNYGQLGLGGYGDCQTPTVVPALRGVSIVAAGGFNSFSLGIDGTVMAWGDNEYGQLGLGDTEDRRSPTMVKGLRHVVDIAAGDKHTIAVTLEGHLCVSVG